MVFSFPWLARCCSASSDSIYLAFVTPPTVLWQSFLNCTDVFVMVWRCACCLDIILRLVLVTFSAFWTQSFFFFFFFFFQFSTLLLSHFWAWILLNCIYSRYWMVFERHGLWICLLFCSVVVVFFFFFFFQGKMNCYLSFILTILTMYVFMEK